MSSVCSIITTASAPRGMTPPVAIAVAVPGSTSTAGAYAAGDHLGIEPSRRGALSLAPAVSAARTAKPSTLERSNGGASTGAITSAASTRAERRGKRNRFGAERRAIDRGFEAAPRLLGRDHFEELLLPRGARDRVEDRGAAGLSTFFGRRLSLAMALPQPAFRPQILRCRPERQSSRRCAPAPRTTDSRRRAAPPCRPRQRTGTSSVMPMVEVTLRPSGSTIGTSSTVPPASLAMR